MTPATTLRRRRLRWIVPAIAALVAGAVGGFIVLWVDGAAHHPVVGWMGSWLKSPGLAGLGAIAAASIAFFGVFLQLHANRERDGDAAWWQSFEWASDRGLPRDPLELGLSFEAALDTLNALATVARTDIQKNAVRGVVDEMLRSRGNGEGGQSPAASDPHAHEEGQLGEGPEFSPAEGREHAKVEADKDSDDAAFAVLRYALQQVGTAAESRRASASAYQTEVLRALRHQYDEVVPMSRSTGGDVIVRTRSRRLVVEIKWAPGTVLKAGDWGQLNAVDAVISNVKVENLPSNVDQIIWDPRRDASTVLRQALDGID